MVSQRASGPAGPLTPPIQVRRNGVRKLHKRWTLAIHGAQPADLPWSPARPLGSPHWDSGLAGGGVVVRTVGGGARVAWGGGGGVLVTDLQMTVRLAVVLKLALPPPRPLSPPPQSFSSAFYLVFEPFGVRLQPPPSPPPPPFFTTSVGATNYLLLTQSRRIYSKKMKETSPFSHLCWATR